MSGRSILLKSFIVRLLGTANFAILVGNQERHPRNLGLDAYGPLTEPQSLSASGAGERDAFGTEPMIPKTRDVKIRHRILKRGGKIRSRRFREGGYEHFNIRVFVEGDIEDLQSVEYQLHPTFRNPDRVVEDPDRGFALDIWTWGEFDIRVTLHFQDGSTEEMVYPLAYSDELPASDSAYTNEGPTARG